MSDAVNFSRRTFLGGMLTVAVVSAIPAASMAGLPTLHGDGIHDDAPALNAFLSGKPFKTADGFSGAVREGYLANGIFGISAPIYLAQRNSKLIIERCGFSALKPMEYMLRVEDGCKLMVRDVTLDCQHVAETSQYFIRMSA